jgi:hypothetical protein
MVFAAVNIMAVVFLVYMLFPFSDAVRLGYHYILFYLQTCKRQLNNVECTWMQDIRNRCGKTSNGAIYFVLCICSVISSFMMVLQHGKYCEEEWIIHVNVGKVI